MNMLNKVHLEKALPRVEPESWALTTQHGFHLMLLSPHGPPRRLRLVSLGRPRKQDTSHSSSCVTGIA